MGGMDDDLCVLLMAKGLGPEQLSAITAADPSLKSMGDLAAGAGSEDDARAWADELGLQGRVLKSRFVQSWLEARAAIPEISAVATASALVPPSTTSAAMQQLLTTSTGQPTPPQRSVPLGTACIPFQESTSTTATHLQAEETRDERQEEADKSSSLPRGVNSTTLLRRSEGATQAKKLSLLPVPSRQTSEGIAPESDETGLPRDGFSLALALKPTAKCPALLGPSIEEEPPSQPGGLTGTLKRVLRACGVTATEVGYLETQLHARTCRELATGATSREAAVRLARQAGLTSRISQENFATAWQECVAATVSLDSIGSAESSQSLADALTAGNFEGCAAILMSRWNVRQKEDLLPRLRAMLADMASESQKEDAASKKHRKNVLPLLATAYGAEAVTQAQKVQELEDADWRWSWAVRSLFTPSVAIALQQQLLQAYQSPSFQEVSSLLNAKWAAQQISAPLEQKMKEVEALCMEHVLQKVLPSFGFSATASGVAEMKAAISQHTKNSAQVRQLHTEISAAIMVRLKL